MNEADEKAFEMAKYYLDRLFLLMEKNQSMQLEYFHALISTDLDAAKYDRLLEFYENQGRTSRECFDSMMQMLCSVAERASYAIVAIHTEK